MRLANAGLRQAYDLRDIAAQEALALANSPVVDTDQHIARASALRALVFSWEAASERIRIIRGRPLPGSLRPQSGVKRRSNRGTAQRLGDAAGDGQGEAGADPKPVPEPPPA